MSGLQIQVVPVSGLAYEGEGPTRGHAHIGWADHPVDAVGHLDFGPLRLFAVGELRPGESVDMHTHENVENILLMNTGRLRHEDTLGNNEVIGDSDIVVMSAGRGMEHAEHVVGDEPVRAIIIWLEPQVRDAAPSCTRYHASRDARRDTLSVLVAGIRTHHHTTILGAVASPGTRLNHRLGLARAVYLVSLDGCISVEGRRVEPNERVLVEGTGDLNIDVLEPTEVIIVDLPRCPVT